MNDISNQILGRYQIINEIGKGAMGKVYHAKHVYTGKKVAVKTLLLGWLSDLNQAERREIEERFRREAQAAAQIDHENVIQIYDFDLPQNGLPAYIAMEYLDGESLESILRKEGKLSLKRAVSIIIQICRGIAEAHKKGFVHRDLKPANIMILPPREDHNEFCKVIDFGIAKVFDSELTKITKHGQLIGTAKYMSPEQCSAEEGTSVDGRSDVYSLGLIFYEMLVGHLPFKSPTYEGWLLCHLLHQPEELPDDIPAEIKNLIMKTLVKKPDERIDSVIDLKEKLELFQFLKARKIEDERKNAEQLRINDLIEKEKNSLKEELLSEFQEKYSSKENMLLRFQEKYNNLENRFKHILQKNEELKEQNKLKGKEISELELKIKSAAFQEEKRKTIEKLLYELRDTHLDKIISEIQLNDEKNENSKIDLLAILNQFQKDEEASQIKRKRSGKKVRVYDLARDLQQDTRRIIEDLRREGADVDVPSNQVSVELAEKVRNKYFPKADAFLEQANLKFIKSDRKEDE